MNQNKPSHLAVDSRHPDFGLITRRLRELALKGEQTQKCLSTLKNNSIRDRLEPDQLLSWFETALIIGDINLALEILELSCERHPSHMAVWKERYDLLVRLNRLEQAQSVRARALSRHPDLAGELVVPEAMDADTSEPDVEDPFNLFRERQELQNLYLHYFQGREDVFARQWVDKAKQTQGYMPVRRPIEAQDILEHIKGHRTYGIYLLRKDSTVKTAVVDMDLKKAFRDQRLKSDDRLGIKRERDYVHDRMAELSLQKFGCKPLCEFSGGKGYHFWFFFDVPVPAALARKLISPLAGILSKDCRFFSLEVFPKQDQLQGKGLGNLVKLPLGLHRVTGKPSYFMGCLRNEPWTNIKKLKEYSELNSKNLLQASKDQQKQNVAIHPAWSEWAEKYPELHLLSERCPPLGRLFSALRKSRELGLREEKVLFQTLGFLSRANHLLHHLLQQLPEYNVHLVNYKLSKLRGTPLGCRKIHQLLNVHLDFCEFEDTGTYPHPLLHCRDYMSPKGKPSEKIENLSDALENLRTSLDIVRRFMPVAGK
ncbi:CRISPR-associated primase-polymerase type A1 [Desulfonatronospira sp.]|uniref:CRISPR-associated primase-polymerase type A1 n=1 Tax=Desulfonatronospira sp. TaxID=1962951 RepID=UPI0025C61CFC|nr:CRISPR-associated primase-polymerase type A1 [Desulfonatronospira sp.]